MILNDIRLSPIKFIAGLLICNVASIVLFFIFIQFFPYHKSIVFISWVLFFFNAISIVFYTIGKYAGSSKNLQLFNGLIIMSTFVKLLGSVVLILSLKSYLGLNDTVQIIPFVICYILFTIYEVYYLSDLGHYQLRR